MTIAAESNFLDILSCGGLVSADVEIGLENAAKKEAERIEALKAEIEDELEDKIEATDDLWGADVVVKDEKKHFRFVKLQVV